MGRSGENVATFRIRGEVDNLAPIIKQVGGAIKKINDEAVVTVKVANTAEFDTLYDRLKSLKQDKFALNLEASVNEAQLLIEKDKLENMKLALNVDTANAEAQFRQLISDINKEWEKIGYDEKGSVKIQDMIRQAMTIQKYMENQGGDVWKNFSVGAKQSLAQLKNFITDFSVKDFDPFKEIKAQEQIVDTLIKNRERLMGEGARYLGGFSFTDEASGTTTALNEEGEAAQKAAGEMGKLAAAKDDVKNANASLAKSESDSTEELKRQGEAARETAKEMENLGDAAASAGAGIDAGASVASGEAIGKGIAQGGVQSLEDAKALIESATGDISNEINARLFKASNEAKAFLETEWKDFNSPLTANNTFEGYYAAARALREENQNDYVTWQISDLKTYYVFLQKLKDELESLGEKKQGLTRIARDAAKLATGQKNLSGVGEALRLIPQRINSISEAMMDAAKNAETLRIANQMYADLAPTQNSTEQAQQAGQQQGDAFAEGERQGIEGGVPETQQAIADSLATNNVAADAGQQVGKDFAENVAAGVEANSGAVKDALDQFVIKNEWTELLGRDFSTGGKRGTTAQLRDASSVYSRAWRRNEGKTLAEWDAEGVAAGYAFIKAYNEAISKGVAQSTLNNYGKGLLEFDKEGLEAELENYKAILQDYARITAEIGNRPITKEVQSSIGEYVKYLSLARSRQALGDQDVSNELELANQARERAISLAQAEAEHFAKVTATTEENAAANEHVAEAKEHAAEAGAANQSEATIASEQAAATEQQAEAEEHLADARQNAAAAADTSSSTAATQEQTAAAESAAAAQEKLADATAQTQETTNQARSASETATAANEEVAKSGGNAAQAVGELIAVNKELSPAAKETIDALAKEAEAIATIADRGKDAAEAKKALSKKNKLLKEAAAESVPALEQEGGAIEKVSETALSTPTDITAPVDAIKDAADTASRSVSDLNDELEDSSIFNDKGDLINAIHSGEDHMTRTFRINDYMREHVRYGVNENGEPTMRAAESYNTAKIEQDATQAIIARIKAEEALNIERAKGDASNPARIRELNLEIKAQRNYEQQLRATAEMVAELEGGWDLSGFNERLAGVEETEKATQNLAASTKIEAINANQRKVIESALISTIKERRKAEAELDVELAKGNGANQNVLEALQKNVDFYGGQERSTRLLLRSYDPNYRERIAPRLATFENNLDVSAQRKIGAVQDRQNRAAINAYRELVKSGTEYYDLLDKEAAELELTESEVARLAELRQAWADATAAKNEYAYGGGSLGAEADRIHSTFDETAYKNAEAEYSSRLDAIKQKISNAVSGGYTEGLQNAAKRLSNDDYTNGVFGSFLSEFKNGLHGPGTGDVTAFLNSADIANFEAAMDSAFYKVSASANKELNVLGGNIQSVLQKSSGMHSGLKQGFQELYRDVMLLNNGMGVSQGTLDDVNARFEELQHQLKASGREGKSLASLVGNQLSNSLNQLVHRYLSVYAMARYAREMVTVIKEIDTSLTELRKVSDASTYRLQQSLLKSTETAKELGATIKDVIDATADWARLGYDVGTAEELARVATLYKNVGDNISIEDANSSLISTLKAYSYLPEEAESIVDKFNEVANNFAIESGGIGNALQRSAAAFNAANTDLSKSIALITAANEVVQNPEQVGTMWTTVSARIRGAKAELTSLDEETDEYVESTSKLRNLVKQISGVDIMANETTFKDIYTIVVEIAEVWDGINDVNRAALLEALAGKRQANRLVAAIENVDTLKRAYQTAEESQGSAMREQANYAKSIQYSLDRFTASLQELSTTLLGSESLKTILDTGNSLIEGFTKLLSSDLGKIAGGVIGGSALMKLLGVGGTLQFGKDGQSVARFINPLGFLGQGVQGKQLVSADVLREINLYNAQYRASINPNIMAPTPVLGAGYFSAESEKIIGTADHLVDTSLLTTQTMRQLLIQQAKAVAMSAAIAAAVAVGVGIIKSLITASDRLAKKASSVGEDFKNAESSLKSYRQRIDELRETLDSPTSSIEEQVAARKQLLSIQSEMIDQYGEEAEKVNLLTARTIQLDGAFLKLAKQQWQDISKEINQSDDFFDTIGDFLANVATGSKNNADRLMKEVDGYSIDNSLRVLLRGRSDLLGDTGQSALSRIDQAGGSNIYDRLTDLEIIRASLTNSNLDENDSTLSRLDSEIEEVKEKIAEVDDFVQSSVLYNEILSADSDSKEVGYYKQITELYDSYQQALVNGEDELAERLKVKTTGALVDAITDGDLSDSVQRYFANMFPALEPELSDEKLLRGLQDSDFVERLQAAIEAGGYQYIDDIGTKQDSEMAEIYTSLGYESAESFVKGLEKGNFYTPLDIKKYRSQLSRSLSALSTGTSTREELDRVKEYTKDFTVAQIKAWLEATKGAVTATEAITKYEWAIRSATDYTAALTDEFSELVDKAQDDVSSISDALTKVFAGTMSSSDLIDLYQKFPELSKESDSLGKALQDLALNKINAVIEKLEEAGANRDILIFLRTLRAETEKTFSNMEEVAGYTSAQMANDGLSVLSSIRQDVEDRGEFDYSSVLGDSFKEQFGGLDSYADFVKTVAEHNDDIEKTQQLFDQLATEWLYSTEMLANLNEENKHFAIKDLSDQGVSNAQEVVESTLKFRENYGDILDILGQIVLAEGEVSDAQAEEARSALELLGIDNSEAAVKQALIEKDAMLKAGITDLNSATASQIDYFSRLINEAGVTNSYMSQLYFTSLQYSGLNIDSTDKIDQILAVARAAGTSTGYVTALQTALERLFTASQQMTGLKNGAYKVRATNSSHNAKKAAKYATEYMEDTITTGYNNARADVDSMMKEIQSILQKSAAVNLDIGKIKGFTGKPSSSSGSSSGSGADAANEFLEVMDWIEVRISRIERDIENLDQTAEATWRKWTDRTKALTSEIAEVNKEIDIQQAGMLRYLQEAESVNLSAYYKERVRNGEIDIERITDEDLKQQIDDYTEWYIMMPPRTVMCAEKPYLIAGTPLEALCHNVKMKQAYA